MSVGRLLGCMACGYCTRWSGAWHVEEMAFSTVANGALSAGECGARRSKAIAHKEKGKTMESKEIMRVDLRDETGAKPAEYAITTLATSGVAALLVVLLKSEPINNILLNLMQTALGMGQ